MKLPLTIILFILLNGCGYGQYPDTRYKGNDVHRLTEGDRGHPLPVTVSVVVSLDTASYSDTVYISKPLYRVQWYNDTIPVTEASFYYWKQYLFYSHEKDIELDKIRKQRNPSYIIYDRLMDSVLKYKKLIDKLSK